ncbi:MAG TPA: Smr/MutS family protein [Bacteroidia bacterium]|jgi:dsDNA-specific endonuclease/ATPase MutS2|nr:Smr/MutS family protein [Bacteroidia bacterium]
MKIKVGDTVRFLNEKGEGIIKEFISSVNARVEIQDGFEITMPIKELVPIAPLSLKDMKVSLKEGKSYKPPVHSVKKSKPHAKDEMTVDLHIEKLMEDYFGMNNTEKLDIQVKYFRRKLEMAINGHFTKIVFIHGVGNGVLRQTIRDLLRTYEGIEYSDAAYSKFGAGATEVRIISRNKSRGSI